MRLAPLALAVASLLSATPALAEDTSLALVARLIGGLADGGETTMGALGKGAVRQIGDGAFEVTFAKGVASFLYDQPDTCIYTQHSQMAGEPSSDARLDFTKVTGVKVQDQGQFEGLNAAVITFEGPPELLMVMMGDQLVPQSPAFAFLVSTITVDEFTAAADELQRIC